MRKDLLLPSDLLDMDEKHAFLVLHSSKTMHRGGGKTQHMKVEDSYVVNLLSSIFGRFDRDVLLY